MTRKKKQAFPPVEETETPRKRWEQLLLLDLGEPAPPSELTEMERAAKRAVRSGSNLVRLLQSNYLLAISERQASRDPLLLLAFRSMRLRCGALLYRLLGTIPRKTSKLPKSFSSGNLRHWAALRGKAELFEEIERLYDLISLPLKDHYKSVRSWWMQHGATVLEHEKAIEGRVESVFQETLCAPPAKVSPKPSKKTKRQKERAS